jgi:hypothetical protein
MSIKVYLGIAATAITLMGSGYSGVTYLQNEAKEEYSEELQFQKLRGDFQLHTATSGRILAELELNDLIDFAEDGAVLSDRQVRELANLGKQVLQYEKDIIKANEFIDQILTID